MLSELWVVTVVGLQAAAIVLTSAHLVLSNRDVPSTVGWMGLVLLAPVVGVALYWVFGINRIERKAHRLRPETSLQSDAASLDAEQRAHRLLEARFPGLVALGHLGDELTQSALEFGNRIRPLVNGDAAYPEMLAAIDTAERSIALSTYIFDNDAAGQQFIAALQGAQARGVAVRVLIDGVGQHYSRPHTPKVLRGLGIPTGVFLESALPVRNPYVNLRNHRKILVVDGALGFTGGLNIREGCVLARGSRNPVQDLHFRIEGPVVRGLMEAFGLDWGFTTGERLGGEAWYPVLEPVGEILARCVPDGPDEDFDVLRRLMLGALAQAQQRVRIITPYFLPDQTLITALNVTAMSGVEVQILVPQRNNLRFVQWAADAQATQILEGRSRIFLTPPPFEHTKLMLIDDAWCFVGSANWDPRSLRLNFELNVECYDCALARRLNGLIDEKLASASELTTAEMQARWLPVRLRDGFARLLMPYL
ncbi:phospholipase D-like domain-containing protein [Halochromatium glycolicum]|uniref:phospholipase D-like domain-containing protein n=1 Tax=Halochromatium glycolicum TaxID=85075 RepID=UPI003B83526C